MTANTIPSFWTPQSLCHHLDGQWLRPPSNGQKLAPLAGLSTDSRSLAAGQAFLALRGEAFDGHNFLAAAARAGAGLLVVDRDDTAAGDLPAGPPVLRVADSLAALQQLARCYRQELAKAGVMVIAVAGSNGKTTTRNLIHTALSSARKGRQSPKSFNNHIGVPLTLLSAQSGDEFLVVEVGSNHPGEIAALGEIVQPDLAVLTSIGHEHMAYFRTLEGVAQEEAAILAAIRPGPHAAAIISSQAWPWVASLGRLSPATAVVRYGLPLPQPLPGDLTLSGPPRLDQHGQLRFATGGLELALPLIGDHNAGNALAAVAVARRLGLSDEQIARGLATAKAVPMRLEVKSLGEYPEHGLLLINDAYNANLDSMKAALAALESVPLANPQGRRIAILGDMLELGEQEPDLHRQLGKALAACPGITFAVLIGKLSLFTAEALARQWPQERIHAYQQWDADLPGRIAALLQSGDVLLIKASRGMALERLVPALEQRFGPVMEKAAR